ncbi:MAG TPA: hypothetical protein VGM59_03345 [Dongiaceae bacterium]
MNTTIEQLGHDLIIGGSGMLAGLAQALAQNGRRVSVMARSITKLNRLAAQHPGIQTLALNYQDRPALERGLKDAAERSGPITRCIAWMHDDDPDRVRMIMRHAGTVYCHVMGSASADPAQPERLAQWRDAVANPAGPTLRIAVLGFVVEGASSRWLTNTEISEGVGRALESADPVTIVGTVTPWEKRP